MSMELDSSRSAPHEVLNQPPPLRDVNHFELDPALGEALVREGGGWGVDRVRDAGALYGSAEAEDACRRAQRNLPILRTHDRFGHRVDHVEYDPGWHWMLRAGVEREIATLPWREPRSGAEVVRAVMFYLANGLDTGPTCPMAMNHAAVPTLRQAPELAAELVPATVLPDYDAYRQWGMVMTEKQGGSDLRANTTRAKPIGDGYYELNGHKWFCSHPVFSHFFTLAQTDAGLTCFVAERRHPGFQIMRLKEKLGGRSLALCEVEFQALPARILGPDGHGIRSMIEQLSWTRLDVMLMSAGMVRRAVAEAVFHCRHRYAFGMRLTGQPAMANVLSDLALESEAMMVAAMRVARAFDSDAEPAFRRVANSIWKYWVCKRGAPAVAEALECLGGNGYVEEAPLARLYRDVEIGTVWEGSGNVMALDVVRALRRDPEGIDCFLTECALAQGADSRLDAALDDLPRQLDLLRTDGAEWSARRVVEQLAIVGQGSLLVRHAPSFVADAFCAARLGDGGRAFGTLPAGVDSEAIMARALSFG
jgi:putative acyl-CoA dehydrogenase